MNEPDDGPEAAAMHHWQDAVFRFAQAEGAHPHKPQDGREEKMEKFRASFRKFAKAVRRSDE